MAFIHVPCVLPVECNYGFGGGGFSCIFGLLLDLGYQRCLDVGSVCGFLSKVLGQRALEHGDEKCDLLADCSLHGGCHCDKTATRHHVERWFRSCPPPHTRAHRRIPVDSQHADYHGRFRMLVVHDSGQLRHVDHCDVNKCLHVHVHLSTRASISSRPSLGVGSAADESYYTVIIQQCHCLLVHSDTFYHAGLSFGLCVYDQNYSMLYLCRLNVSMQEVRANIAQMRKMQVTSFETRHNAAQLLQDAVRSWRAKRQDLIGDLDSAIDLIGDLDTQSTLSRRAKPRKSAGDRVLQAQAAFAAYDSDASGAIDLQELRALLDDWGFPGLDSEVFLKHDSSGDGFFQFDEFVNIINELLDPESQITWNVAL